MATFHQTEICTSCDVRVDRYLKRLYPALNQSYIEKLLRNKKIIINGKKSKSNDRLNIDDTITIFTDLSAFKESILEKSSHAPLSKADRTLIEDCIVYEDESFCIFNKPHGLAVQGGSGIQRHVDGLFKKYKMDVHYKLVHRLDRDTSGLLILAKSIEAAQYFTQLFKTHTIHKTYLALVHGRIKNPQGTISAPLLKDYEQDVEKMIVSDKGKEALTDYVVLGYHAPYTLVELSPKTGRTHQLRVHMQHIGHPIVGDYKYGAPLTLPKTRLHLHAHTVTFPYGKRQTEVIFKADITEKALFACVAPNEQKTIY